MVLVLVERGEKEVVRLESTISYSMNLYIRPSVAQSIMLSFHIHVDLE